MFGLTTIAALTVSALFVHAANDLDKRAPSQWQLHPFGDTYDRVSKIVLYWLLYY